MKVPIHIALDFDKTLGYREIGQPPNGGPLGEPILKMVEKAKGWLAKGYRVSIFTARASRIDKMGERKTTSEINRQKRLIEQFLFENGLPNLDITAEKYGYFTHFVDDKAVPVELNTGEILLDQSNEL